MMMTKKLLGIRVLTCAQVEAMLEEARRQGHEEGRAVGYCEGSDDTYGEIEARLAAAGVGGSEDDSAAGPPELLGYCQGSDDAYASLATALGVTARRQLHA